MRSHYVLVALLVFGHQAARSEEPAPQWLDDRIVVECYASEPDIVTPTGLAVDARGRVLVIECHTHFRPEGYEGPPADRLRWLIDSDSDGRADQFTTYFEGTRATMGVAIAESGWVYVATRNEILRLRDTDGDDRADQRELLAHLETRGNYPHNGLSGFAFDFRGGVYFGLGENLGADYRLIGADGDALSGGGEGGSIYHMAGDGTSLARIATGFWNPFHLALDPWERLYAVDNDPDSRPPCRLLHVVPGGDYGYRYRNGRKGLHPFTAWNGELPGTLPMLAGTGEAPSGVIVYESDGLPAEYRGEILATSWGDHRIERFRPEQRGASFRAKAVPWITGGENFRPVGIAAAPDGSLFISDWVDKSYELHGRGAIWHVRATQAEQRKRTDEAEAAVHASDQRQREQAARKLAQAGSAGVTKLLALVESDPQPGVRGAALKALIAADQLTAHGVQFSLRDQSVDVRSLALRSVVDKQLDELDPNTRAAFDDTALAPEIRAELLRRAPAWLDRKALLTACGDEDPFVQAAAIAGLRRRTEPAGWIALSSSQSAHERLASVWLLQSRSESTAVEALDRLLLDADPRVRFAAIEWVAGRRLYAFRPQLMAGLATPGLTRHLFEGYLAALEQLDAVPPTIEGQSTDRPFVAPVRDVSGQEYIATLLNDEKTSPELRARALRMLEPDHPLVASDTFTAWLGSPAANLRLEAIRTLRESTRDDRAQLLVKISGDANCDLRTRAEAIIGLSSADAASRAVLLDLVSGAEPALRNEALRSLRGTPLTEAERQRLSTAKSADAQAAALYEMLLQPAATASPGVSQAAGAAASTTALDTWITRLAGTGDPEAGERVYFHPQGPLCYRCHQIDGRGARVGPDLTNTPQSLTHRRLVESIVDPGKEIAPQFVAWNVVTTDGHAVTGVLLLEDADGSQTYADPDGKLHQLRISEIAERAPQSTSLMPVGVVERMTLQEFRDLLAYLSQRREW
jgi:putative membrane-bound dehydrogenase-like protein